MTDTQKAAMEQALDYLDAPSSKIWPAGTHYKITTALRAALAETAEPVAWMDAHDPTNLYYRKPPQGDVVPLCRAAPQPPAPAVESDDLTIAYMAGYHAAKKAPAVELTDMEIAGLWVDILSATHKSGVHEDGIIPHRFARAAIAAHEAKKGQP